MTGRRMGTHRRPQPMYNLKTCDSFVSRDIDTREHEPYHKAVTDDCLCYIDDKLRLADRVVPRRRHLVLLTYQSQVNIEADVQR